MKFSAAYASPVEEIYDVASAIPVTTWMTNATAVALPNTYHHPVSGGTGCSASAVKNAIRPVRFSNASMNSFSSLGIAGSSERDSAGENFDLAVANPHRILE